MEYCEVGSSLWGGVVRYCGLRFDYGDGKPPEKYQCERCQIKGHVERLEATLEDRASKADSPLLASDAYYEIASRLAPDGGSVIEAAEALKSELHELKGGK